ncbi:MAG: hypothetical protein QM532_00915 [Cyanobium sp. MAG06]|nr:hypothetical protein [Cyanobium sp. MAG06]
MPNFERLRNVAVRQVIRLEDVINRLLEKIGNKITSLKDFAKDLSVADNMNSPSGSVDNNKENIKKSLIVGFLAILELLKQNIIVAEESEGDIKISKI